MTVHAVATVDIVDSPQEIAKAQPPKFKPFLRVTLEGLPPFDITTNLAEMIGGAGTGLRKRYEAKLGKSH